MKSKLDFMHFFAINWPYRIKTDGETLWIFDAIKFFVIKTTFDEFERQIEFASDDYFVYEDGQTEYFLRVNDAKSIISQSKYIIKEINS